MIPMESCTILHLCCGLAGCSLKRTKRFPTRHCATRALQQFSASFTVHFHHHWHLRASEANYGGRVTDAHDRITITNLVTDYYCEDILKDVAEKLRGSFQMLEFGRS